MVKVDGKRRRVALGDYPTISLKEARTLVTSGEAAAQAKAANEVASAQVRAGSLLELCQAKVDAMEAAGQRDVKNCRHYLIDHPDSAVAVIGGDKLAADVTPDDVTT